MQNFQFFALFVEYPWIYLISYLISSLPLFIIAKRYTRSWIDPLRILVFFVSFANVIPLFLFFIKEIPIYLFFYFICSETLFWLGFVVFASKKIVLSTKKLINEKKISALLYFFFYTFYVSSTLFSYLNFGIPIFAESRLTTLQGSGGFGIISRLNAFFVIYLSIYSYYQLDKKKSCLYRFFPIIVFVTIAAFGILSGSRSSFLTFVFAYFGYQYFYKGILPNVKKVIKYAPLVVGGALAVLLITNPGSLESAFINLGYRFIASGDVYWMAYPNETINSIHMGDSFSYLFSGILGPLRLIDNMKISPPVGAQLTWIVNPILQGIMVGPNARPPVLGYVLFGWFGLPYSFIIGLFTSFLLFKIPAFFPRGLISTAFVLYIYLNAQTFVGDPPLGTTYLFDILLNFFFLLLTIILFSFIEGKKLFQKNQPNQLQQ